jgi:NADH:ubiquinone oxidoreductase subunit F (NADH-binding)
MSVAALREHGDTSADPEARADAEARLQPVAPSSRRLLPAGGASWAEHVDHYGPLPQLRGRSEALRLVVEESGLTGRGGAGFPTAIKLRSVAGGAAAVVVANGTEGEPASAKDKALMTDNPHLILDGVLTAIEAVHADEAIIAIARTDRSSRASLEAALRERRVETRTIRLAAVPARFVAGEESALVHRLNGGEAKPTFAPPRPFERGVKSRPTLVQNVETLANLGLIARYGAAWFRQLGLDDEPGSVLVTVLGAIRQPRVIEVALGTPLRRLIELCGGPTSQPQALLVGGYFGSWITAAGNLDLPLADAALRPLGAALGARTIAVLPRGVCGLAETARVVRYLAGESAGQCGPCIFGLPAVAQALETIARGGPAAAEALARLPRLEAQIAGRGACAHPDGALRLVVSALAVFAAEIEHHVAGRCTASAHQPFLPSKTVSTDWR